MFLELALVSIVTILVSLVVYARWNYGTLEALNIPVVPRTFCLGSSSDLHKKIQHYEDIARFKTYGSVYGAYEGRMPVIYVCDPELIRLIFVKDFDHFHNRREIDLGDQLVNEFLDFLPIEKWREIRSQFSPTFTINKLRIMSKVVQEANQEFCARLKNMLHEDGIVDKCLKLDVRKLFDGLVMDFVCRSAFGINIGDPLDSQNKFVRLFKELQGSDNEFGLMYTLSMSFPILTKFSPTLASDSAKKITEIISSVMKARKQSGKRQNDFIDTLNDMYDKIPSVEYKKLRIDETAVMAQAINFVLAGYDAMTTTMTMLLYFIAKNSQVQEKLLDEIDSFVESQDGEIPFDKINYCVYLKACINETLRLCPPFIRPERICTKDWEHKGLKITKGLVVMINSWGTNRHPNFYDQPNEFNPERYLPENKSKLNPYAFATYGHGPRNCVGLKYANLQMQFSILHFLRHFRVQLCDETAINYKPGVLFLIMYGPVILKLVERQ